jgi:hypothetical protein
MRSSLQMRDWLNTWLEDHASAAWASDAERLDDLEDVVRRLQPGTGRRWQIERATQMTGDPGGSPGHRTVFVVSNSDDGGLYDSPSELRARSMAGALNALEDHLKKSRG